ncbi:DUF4331 domain-containing protein [Alkalisalibacterium limincola]|uniref:DUF4331 domain-containing protein n=2 Tax=Alkalisalibacterium limincola TaxID=2699169 RepID=A0A5C8L0U4_9GAMM|nr:DUF4331 domain-containing protein [Alkalisalibacterium limincola]
MNAMPADASSHREAPLIAGMPKVDGTDFYMFRSYEEGREDHVVFIANYLPLQDAYGGPNYFQLDPLATYEIHIDNTGNAQEDITFVVQVQNNVQNLTIPVDGVDVAVPLSNIGSFGLTPTENDGVKNVIETYTVSRVEGRRNFGKRLTPLQNLTVGGTTFRKPFDNIGEKSFPEYETYANNHIYDIRFGTCGDGRVFVGQRNDGFAVNLGEIFDLINTDPLGPEDAGKNVLADQNVTSIALEVPVSCLTSGSEPVIGAWTTATLPLQAGRAQAGTRMGQARFQVSRLGAPLVNEVVIGLPDKDSFNASHPSDDGQFATYVTNPTLPALIEILFSAPAPDQYPRTDLVAAFLTGVEGLNQPMEVTASEMLRLNTAIAPTARAEQANMGVIAGDVAGFPNGRRPGDDVVDIALRVMMGVLLPEDVAPAGQLPLTDGAAVSALDFPAAFPYLNTPLPGSPFSAGTNAVGTAPSATQRRAALAESIGNGSKPTETSQSTGTATPETSDQPTASRRSHMDRDIL